MGNVSSRGKKRAASGMRAIISSWYETKRPFLPYVGKFVGLLILFTILSLTSVYKSLLEWEVLWTANVAHWVMSIFGGATSIISGATLYRGEAVILEVKAKCSGLYFCWVFCSAVLAFPVKLWVRFIGVFVGSAILLILNIVRVVSLFLVGSYHPGWFTPIHEQFWPVFSLLMTVVLLGAWLFCIKGLITREEE